MENRLFAKKYVLMILLVFLTLVAITFALAYHAYSTTNPNAANQTLQQVNKIRQNITPQSIFLNNFLVSIPAIVPIAGSIIFGRVWINTGQTIGQLAYSYRISPYAYVIGVYVPVGTIESLAYAVIIVEGLFLTYSFKKGSFVDRLKNQTWKYLVLYFVLLAIAAVVEAGLINGS